MRLIAFFCLALVSLTASSQTSPNQDEIIAQENLFWTNYTSGNVTGLSAQFAPEFTNVEQKIWNRDQTLSFVKAFFAKCTLEPVKLVNPRVSFITPDIATIVYQATESPTCNGGTMTGDVNVSTAWVRRDGHWLMHLHTEYALRPGGR
jgi:hypothetical protein